MKKATVVFIWIILGGFIGFLVGALTDYCILLPSGMYCTSNWLYGIIIGAAIGGGIGYWRSM